MREERAFTPARFLALLNHFVHLSTQYYNAQHLRDVIIPRVSRIQLKVVRISGFAYGLIAMGVYERAYLSELNHLINEFVREFEEILDCLGCSDEDKFSKLEGHIYAFELRLVVLEDEVMRDYVLKTLEEYLQSHRSVLGNDFGLKDLFYLLKRVVDVEEEGESPLTPA
jgi:hypothetical protein